jgi:hypothetical protein
MNGIAQRNLFYVLTERTTLRHVERVVVIYSTVCLAPEKDKDFFIPWDCTSHMCWWLVSFSSLAK